jgi:phosphonate transport system permease protein
MPASPALRTSLGLFVLALACLAFADVTVTTAHPWREITRLALGIVTPDFVALQGLGEAVVKTVAFAFLGIFCAAGFGFVLALTFHLRPVRLGCAVSRAIHELFWALILLQIFGLHPLTGVLAIAIPFAAACAKVYAEILEEADTTPLRAMPAGAGHISVFFYARLPDVWVHIKTYTLYRLECALRSSAVLGFVGLPTLGFYLQPAFAQGRYSEASALLMIFYVLIATIRLWVRRYLILLYLAASPFVLMSNAEIDWANVTRFFLEDIVPYPLRTAESLDPKVWVASGLWLWNILRDQAIPGAIATVILTQIALVGSGILALASFPLISCQFFGPSGRAFGHLFLVVVRSTPEYILGYVFLTLWGPSMLPAVVALALHNGAIIGHLTGRYSDAIVLRPDSPQGFNRYSYELLPRLYGQFLAFLFYRWEIIFRESAILGMLGIYTLGFYVDSAFAELRFDRALVLIAITAMLNIGIDVLSRTLRARLRLRTTPTCT